MRNIKPIITEKSLQAANEGKYTFKVNADLTKHKIKEAISKLFGVSVKSIRTMKYKPESRLNMYRRKVVSKGYKKAIVTLADKQTIEVFSDKKQS